MILTGRDLRGTALQCRREAASSEGGGAPIPRTSDVSTIRSRSDRVRHLGEAVAAVVAVSEAVAVDAAADVVVDWEPLPAVADPFEAMAAGAP